MKPSAMYLLLYNATQAIGWLVILVKAVNALLHNPKKGFHSAISFELQLFQTLAALEVVHCMLRLVRSPVGTTAMQLASRILLVWPVTWRVDSAQQSIGVMIYVFAWSITEVIRYSYYACNLLNCAPYFLTWARYTLFIVLYPLGVMGELLTVWAALTEVKTKKIYTVEMPNRANISFSYYHVLIVFMLLYIPLFPQLYFYMFRQRKKTLYGEEHKKTE